MVSAAFVTGLSASVRPAVARPQLCSRAFFGARAVTPAAVSPASVRMGIVLPVFTKAMADFKEDYPAFAARGWGSSVKAEIWNGRHAMVGWLLLVGTAYCKGHGLIPDASAPLDLSQWGTLGTLGDTNMVTNERAIILVAHIHLLFVSIAATLAPFSFQDKLFLAPGEKDAEPAGLIPDFKGGLTREAEVWNSRVAMVGLLTVVGISFATQTSILDVINAGVGGLLY